MTHKLFGSTACFYMVLGGCENMIDIILETQKHTRNPQGVELWHMVTKTRVFLASYFGTKRLSKKVAGGAYQKQSVQKDGQKRSAGVNRKF